MKKKIMASENVCLFDVLKRWCWHVLAFVLSIHACVILLFGRSGEINPSSSLSCDFRKMKAQVLYCPSANNNNTSAAYSFS